MVHVEIKYVKRQVRTRKRRDGSTWERVYWYYRRPGAPDHGKPLPGDPSRPEFLTTLREFNQRAEAAPAIADPASFAALVDRYTASPEFAGLADRTRKDYGTHLGMLRSWLGDLPTAGITRSVVYEIRDQMAATPRKANFVLAVLRLLLSWAVDRGMMDVNHAKGVKQLKTRPRQHVWGDDAEARFLTVAPEQMRLAFLLGIYTAQRQGDILRMTWNQYDGETIQLRQSKTGRPVRVPCHRVLKQALDAAPRRAVTILVTDTGRAFKEDHFRHEWRAATLAAGLDGLQFRDLRRTAMVRLAEAGASHFEVAAVSGHDIDTTQRILDVYVPRNEEMAHAAIFKLERHDRGGTRTQSGKQVRSDVENTGQAKNQSPRKP
ncbi:tyrosine-type recombinase/integrase [Tistrella mobilis]|uniref:tyrosine-type recombinase/integrase n=1 Tax=Tistrella mobilis TaxID=171437 RepID=UPI00355908B2